MDAIMTIFGPFRLKGFRYLCIGFCLCYAIVLYVTLDGFPVAAHFVFAVYPPLSYLFF